MPRLSPTEIHRRGVAAINRGHIRRADQLLRTALVEASEPDLLARISASLAYTEAELGDRTAALERCAAVMRRADLSPQARAIVRSQQAVLMSRGGDLAAVIGLFDLAFPALEPGSPERANALMNRGIAHLELGDLAKANQDFRTAASDYRLVQDGEGAATAEHNQGYVQLLLGDLVGALELMDRAEAGLVNAGLQVRTVGLQDRAEVLLAAGMTRDAVVQLEQVVKNFTTLRLPRMRAEGEVVLGRALLWLDPARTRLLARAAGRRLRKHGNASWALRADTLELLAEATDTKPAASWLGRAESVSVELREYQLTPEAQLLDLTAAHVAVAHGQLDLAKQLLDRGETNARDSLTERLLERRVKADLAFAAGRRGTGLGHLQAGLDLLAQWQSSFSSLDLLSSVVGHGRLLATTGIQVALSEGLPANVFNWSELARALTSRIAPVRPPRDQQMAADLVQIRQLTTTEPAAGSAQAKQLAQLRDRVRKRAWRAVGSGEVNQIATLTKLQSELDPDSGLVSYLWDGHDRLAAIVATGENAVVVGLGESAPVKALLAGLQADLDVSASELPASMAAVVTEARNRRLAQLAEILVSPVLEHLGQRRLVITQAGILAGIPWSMLPGLIGRTVTVAPTASWWLDHRGTGKIARLGFVAGPQVRRAVEEVEVAAACWPSAKLLSGADANVAAVIELCGQVDLLHISAHGKHAGENPLFSGLSLADGPLFGYDLDQAATVPQVVILSACEVGRTTQRWAEESLGLVHAWLHAGAKTVIASPAAVADDQACEILPKVHRLLAQGEPPAVALAEATKGSPTSFVCFGAGW